jgi:AhpD family alkylhydroperoxidase
MKEDTMSQTPSLMTEAVAELVAIGAAIASNCEPCFRYHFDAGRRLGLSKADMRKAVDLAVQVKAAPHRKVLETADLYLAAEEPAAAAAGAGCCAAGNCG